MLQHPVIRIVIASLVIISSVALAQSGLHTLRERLPLPVYYGLFAAGSIVVMLATYCAYVRLVEVRTPDEVMTAGAVGELAGGTLIGAGLVAAIVGSLWLVGAYVVTDVALSIAMVGVLATDVAGGLVEEILFRAVIFRIGRELVGTRWALLLLARSSVWCMPARSLPSPSPAWVACCSAPRIC